MQNRSGEFSRPTTAPPCVGRAGYKILLARKIWAITAGIRNIGFKKLGDTTMDGPKTLTGLVFAGTAIAIVLAFIVA